MSESTSAVFGIEWRRPSIDERIVSGIAVPYGETSFLAGDPKGERFLPGSLTRSVKARGPRLKLYRGGQDASGEIRHTLSAPIGRPIELDARRAEGLFTAWQIAKTPAGDAALEEIAEGMLDAFSIGFRPIRAQRGSDGAREIAEAEIIEVNVLPMGAYESATVTEVRAPLLVVDRPALDELDAWLAAHPMPEIDRTPTPELRLWRG